MRSSPLPREFYAGDSRDVAPRLLGKLLVRGEMAGRIVEVEAYCGDEDPGSHAFRGQTPRNATMFGEPGLLYVYFTYGMHWCANAVCGGEGWASAVLIRALHPVAGIELMRARRAAVRRGRASPALADRDLTNGPAKLCQALGIERAADGADLVRGDRGITVLDDGAPPPAVPGQSTRIGLSAGAEHPWRWYVPGDPYLSRREPMPPDLPAPPAARAAGRRTNQS